MTPIEWSTRVLAQVSMSSSGAKSSDVKEAMKSIEFPWENKKTEQHSGPVEADDDLSWLETGDLTAAEKNEGKEFNWF